MATARASTLVGTTGWALLVVAALAAQGTATKTWVRSTDWAAGGNWLGGRPPCARDRAVLPAWLTAAVRLPEGDTAIAELLLPRSGELILPTAGSLLFTDLHHPAAPDCHGEEVVFSRTEAAAWLDGASWRQEAGAAGAAAAAALAAGALPHLERVPCMLERAVFPAGSSFLVHLPEVPVSVGFLEIDGEELDQESWRSLLQSEPGRRQFRSPEGWLSDAVSVASESCRLPSGCPCQRPLVLPAVCRHAQPCQPPQQLPCLQPVTPRGHCCPICGAYLLLQVELGRFWLERLRRAVGRLVPDGVVPWASVVDLDASSLLVQVVLADQPAAAAQGASAAAAQGLADALLHDRELGVVSASVFSSGPALRGGAALALLAFMVGALAAVLLLMAALFFLFVHRQGQTLLGDRRPFVFARFENTDQEDSHVSVVAPQPPPPEKAFDNPMYGAEDAAVSQDERKAALSAPATYTELQSRVETQELVDVDIDAAPASVSSDV